jgi:hypothetical protein
VRKPTLGAILLGCIPFVAMCLTVALWDHIRPMVFGIPFNLFWLTLWILLTPACMWGAYRCERRAESLRPPGAKGAAR